MYNGIGKTALAAVITRDERRGRDVRRYSKRQRWVETEGDDYEWYPPAVHSLPNGSDQPVFTRLKVGKLRYNENNSGMVGQLWPSESACKGPLCSE